MLTERQIKYLHICYNSKLSINQIADCLENKGVSISRRSIRYHLKKLGLTYRYENGFTPWPDEANRYLESSYPDEEASVIISELQKIGIERNWYQIKRYARNRGLKRSSMMKGKSISDGFRKTVKNARRMIELGINPHICIRNFGNAMPKKLLNLRYKMKTKFGYILIKYDQDMYYDDNTTRDEIHERQYSELGRNIKRLKQ